jgi:hypothetical protein
VVAACGFDDGQRVKRVGLARILPDDLAIELRSLREVAASVQRKGLLQRFVTLRHGIRVTKCAFTGKASGPAT